MTYLGSIPVSGAGFQRVDLFKKDDQNSLKGLAWQAAGTTFSFGALATTAAVTAVTLGAFTGMTLPGYMSFDLVEYGPLVPLAVGAAVIVNILVVDCVTKCFENAMYHLGPQVEIRYEGPENLKQHDFKRVVG